MVVAQVNNMMLQDLPGAVVWILAAMAVAGWVAGYLLLHRVSGRPRVDRALLPALRMVAGVVAMMLALAALGRLVLLNTTWPIWLLALAGATCVESLVALYALERRVVGGRGGKAILGLRLALAMGLILMLAQPVWSWDLHRGKPRTVAVLLDNSASMHISQKYLSPADKVRLGEAMGLVKRPYGLDAFRGELEAIQRKLIETRDWLATLRSVPSANRGRQILTRRGTLKTQFTDALKTLETHTEDLWGADGEAGKILPIERTVMVDIESKVTTSVAASVRAAANILDGSDAGELADKYTDLLGRTSEALAALAEVQQTAGPLADKLDAAYHASLDDKTAAALDAMAIKTRYQLAREVLERRRGGAESLLALLGNECAVDLYAFDSSVRQMAPEEAGAGGGETTSAQQQTALAGAMEKVLSDSEGTRLIGVVVLSDMRHNGPGHVQDISRQFGWKSIPVCPVVFGSSQAPPDAAISSISAPETLFPEDKLFVSAKLKLDGLAGKDVVVTLNDDQTEVDRQVVHVPDVASLRHEVQLSCEPDKLGDHTYRLRIEPVDGEALASNNETPFSVKVHDDRTKMLLIDSHPRWEMRYLKNLFTNRDTSVNLQYVILNPDRTAGEPRAKTVHASVSRPRGQTEANALPESTGEWLKFDVIILGDVAPQDLGAEAVEALAEFVTERSGTLICIAGERDMPHAFGGSPLAKLLPVTFAPGPEAPEMEEKAFRIDLTSEGAHSVITRMEVDPVENKRVWDELPDIYWRHPITGVRDGATVLAYARGADVPGPIRSDMDAAARKARLAEIRDYQRSRALVAHHSAGRGRVMFLAFDRTWRLRYRQGDTYHHRYWGQVLRWAMADRLASGTGLVKLGTDRVRYTIDDRVAVRAQIYNVEDNTGLTDKDVTVEVYRDVKSDAEGLAAAGRKAELVMRRVLTPVENSPGAFSGDLGEMKIGAYRVALVGDAVAEILEKEGTAKTVETSFTVDPAASGEQVELAADRVLAGQVAGSSGGLSVEPAQVERVLEALGLGDQTEKPKLSQWDLWDSWPLLLALLALVTGEWLIRKRIGLT